MNHHGTLNTQYNAPRGRRRNDHAPIPESSPPFNAFGAGGENRSRRRPLNTAAASAAADSHRNAANDFWSTNQGWAESDNGAATNQAWAEPQPANWSDGDWQGERNWSGGNKPAWHSDPNWNTHQGWGEARSWPDDSARRSHHSHPEPEPHHRPTTIAEALEQEPATEEPEEKSAQSRARGAHRVSAPPSALKGRAAVVAVAAGAVVAAGQCATAAPGEQKQLQAQASDYEAVGSVHEIAAQSKAIEGAPIADTHSPQMLGAGAPLDTSRFGEMLANGEQFARDLAEAEAAKFRPLFSQFASGAYTSGFGARWGVQHLGIDIAAPIGTPIYTVADGEVIDSGPASGFGMWVRVLHADGTVTVYGHVDTTTVSVGEYVLAGDQIATMGNRGFSTGPHVHFEVWLNGSDKIDPVPWLATRGISLNGNGD